MRIGFPTGDTNHDGSGNTAATQTMIITDCLNTHFFGTTYLTIINQKIKNKKKINARFRDTIST